MIPSLPSVNLMFMDVTQNGTGVGARWRAVGGWNKVRNIRHMLIIYNCIIFLIAIRNIFYPIEWFHLFRINKLVNLWVMNNKTYRKILLQPPSLPHNSIA